MVILPYEQRFLCFMALRVYEVVRVACLSCSWFVYPPRETGSKQTKYATDKPRERLRKP